MHFFKNKATGPHGVDFSHNRVMKGLIKNISCPREGGIREGGGLITKTNFQIGGGGVIERGA